MLLAIQKVSTMNILYPFVKITNTHEVRAITTHIQYNPISDQEVFSMAASVWP